MMLDKKECEMYDERQIRERGIIFKLSFFMLVVYNIVTAILSEYCYFWSENFSTYQSNFIGIILVTTIGSILMISKDAYISPIRPEVSNISIGLLTFSSIMIIPTSIKQLDFFSLIVSICLLAICCTYWIKLFIDKKKININDED